MYKFTKLDHVEVVLEDCCTQIKCPNCGKELWLDSQNGIEECECGKLYHLSTIVYEVTKDNVYTR